MPDELLPRLLYVGDVPVEASYHGSALLYRLLQRYPPDRLMIAETNLVRPGTNRRLRDVRYVRMKAGWPRLLRTRFSTSYARWLTRRAPSRAAQLAALTAGFMPEAVLTVAHGYSWLTAARFAVHIGVPLHLIYRPAAETYTWAN